MLLSLCQTSDPDICLLLTQLFTNMLPTLNEQPTMPQAETSAPPTVDSNPTFDTSLGALVLDQSALWPSAKAIQRGDFAANTQIEQDVSNQGLQTSFGLEPDSNSIHVTHK